MYKTLLLAALVAVVMGQRNNDSNDRQKPERDTDFNDRAGQKEGGSKDKKSGRDGQSKGDMKENSKGKKCKPCKEGYVQVEDSCRCNAEDTAAPICREGDVNAQCGCDDGEDAKCFYSYRGAWIQEYNLGAAGDCSCVAPPTECDVQCERGQKKNVWDCVCEDQPICDPCEQGFKQHPWTCECKDYYTMDMKCKYGGAEAVFASVDDQCTCSWTNDDGEDQSRDAKCMRGYTASDDCTTCNWEDKSRRIQCPKEQGWSVAQEKCITMPECPEDANTDCPDGEYFSKTDCQCYVKAEKKQQDKKEKNQKNGKSGQDGQKGDKSDKSSDRRPRQQKEQKLNLVQ